MRTALERTRLMVPKKTLLTLAAASILLGAAARADRIEEYDTGKLAVDPDGAAVHYTSAGSLASIYLGGSYDARLFPGATELGAMVAGTDSYWVVEPGGNRIWREPYFNATPTSITLPTTGSVPVGITIGPDANVWFTELGTDKLARLIPPSTITEYLLPHTSTSVSGIAGGHDGKVWFVENAGNRFGSISASTGAIVEHDLPTPNSYPSGIAASYSYIAFTESGSNRIGLYDLVTTQFTEHPVPTAGSGPMEIVWGVDGAFWFTEFSGNKIGRFDPATHAFTEYPVPTAASQPSLIALLKTGDVVFSEQAAKKIGVLRLHAPGDMNGDGTADVSDVFYLLNYLFAGGPVPQ
jgi:virginiamycin B lyase